MTLNASSWLDVPQEIGHSTFVTSHSLAFVQPHCILTSLQCQTKMVTAWLSSFRCRATNTRILTSPRYCPFEDKGIPPLHTLLPPLTLSLLYKRIVFRYRGWGTEGRKGWMTMRRFVTLVLPARELLLQYYVRIRRIISCHSGYYPSGNSTGT